MYHVKPQRVPAAEVHEGQLHVVDEIGQFPVPEKGRKSRPRKKNKAKWYQRKIIRRVEITCCYTYRI